jgi:hypothetical protein
MLAYRLQQLPLISLLHNATMQTQLYVSPKAHPRVWVTTIQASRMAQVVDSVVISPSEVTIKALLDPEVLPVSSVLR